VLAVQDPNSSKAWDQIWSREGSSTWRTYPVMFAAVAALVPEGSRVLDLGCGAGKLLDLLARERGCSTQGLDTSPVAIGLARAGGHAAHALTLCPQTAAAVGEFARAADVVTATEVLEHLDDATLDALLASIRDAERPLIATVPDDRLPPSVCSEHRQCWSKATFTTLLGRYFTRVEIARVDDRGPRLVAHAWSG